MSENLDEDITFCEEFLYDNKEYRYEVSDNHIVYLIPIYLNKSRLFYSSKVCLIIKKEKYETIYEIADIEITEEYRSEGHGTLMLKCLLYYLENNKCCDKLTGYISSVDQVERLKKWYMKHGFEVTNDPNDKRQYLLTKTFKR